MDTPDYQQNEPDLNRILDRADQIGSILEACFPAMSALEPTKSREEVGGPGLIPHQVVTQVAETLTLVIAEILQSWLDAGSEREVTLEELGGVIEDHVRGWSNHPDNLDINP